MSRRSVLQDVERVLAHRLQVRPSLLLLGRGLREGRGLHAAEGVDRGGGGHLRAELVWRGWRCGHGRLFSPEMILVTRNNDQLVCHSLDLYDVLPLVLLGQLQVAIQLVGRVSREGNGETQEPHPGQSQTGQQVGGLS